MYENTKASRSTKDRGGFSFRESLFVTNAKPQMVWGENMAGAQSFVAAVVTVAHSREHIPFPGRDVGVPAMQLEFCVTQQQ